MITFFASILLLILGYIFYGRFVEHYFGADPKRVTPAVRLEDGVDFKVMPKWKLYVIQFLNIAGLGPIFGAILGAAYGPVAYIWIVIGCIFMGATYDYFSGMLSLRNDGRGLPFIIAKYLGKNARIFILIFTALLLIAVGSSFVSGPADLLASLTSSNKMLWVYAIFIYYLIATLVPIDKIIGRIYPVFGFLLFAMAFMVAVVMLIKGFSGELTLTELTLDKIRNYHSDPSNNILIPMLFVVVSCGAISGFHATQSPLMARCMANEKYGRPVFYGAMISEGIVAIIWATAAMAYFGGAEGLNAAADSGMTPAIMVNEICNSWLGKVGAIIAIIGVVVCPITTGDTAFRSLRLIIADNLKYNQKPLIRRIIVAIPIFIVAYIVCSLEFSIIWKYVGIGNQVMASIMLWAGSVYLVTKRKNHLILSITATFITFVCVSYFMMAPHINGGLHLSPTIGYICGIAVAIALFILFLIKSGKIKKELLTTPGQL